MTRVGPAPSHSALSRACANSLSKQQGPSPAPGATDVTGGGTPVPLPRQRPGSAAAHVSRVPGCPRSSCHRAGAARAVCACPTQARSCPHADTECPRARSRRPHAQESPLSHAQLLLSPRSRHCPHAHAPVHVPTVGLGGGVRLDGRVQILPGQTRLLDTSQSLEFSVQPRSLPHSPSQRCHHCWWSPVSLGQCPPLLGWLQLSKEVFSPCWPQQGWIWRGGHCEHLLHGMRGCHCAVTLWGLSLCHHQARPHPILERMMSDVAGEGTPRSPEMKGSAGCHYCG